jgi:hypothetical protein
MLTNSYSPFRLLKRKPASGTGPLKSGHGNNYIENDLLSPTTEEIKDACPLATVLPQNALAHALLIAAIETNAGA